MIVMDNVQQGSERWFAMRRGRPTASNFSRILTAKKVELAAARWAYMDELIAECYWPELNKWEGNFWTDRGEELEPIAREDFSKRTGMTVKQVGFITRDDGIVGCSPDGLIVDADGNWLSGLEMKCPAPKTHVRYVREGELPDDYKAQVHGSMAVTGLDTWHFFSYCPRLQPFHLVVERDAYTERLSKALDTFLIEYQEVLADVRPKLTLPE
jgi:predicted phage-related endonuclease